MGTIGCDVQYEAFIVNSLTGATLLSLPWSEITWNRVRSEMSDGTVTVAQADGGIECCGPIGGLFGWSQSLLIERNGETVWDGPITGWSRPGGGRDLKIRAKDRSALFLKRLVHTSRQFSSVTPYSVMLQLAADANVGNIAYDPFPVGLAAATPPPEAVTREYLVERGETLYTVFKELTQNTVTGFWTAQGATIYLDELTISDFLGRAGSGDAPKLSEATTVGLPGIDVDCLGMATITYAAGSGQGVSGFPLIVANSASLGLFLNSTLEKFSAEDRSATTTDLSLVAGRGAAESTCPATTLERIQLGPDFGSEFMHPNLDNFLPGCQVDIDFESTCAFDVPMAEYREVASVPGLAYTTSIGRARIDQIDGTVSRSQGGGVTETIFASCRPIILAVSVTAPAGEIPPDREPNQPP